MKQFWRSLGLLYPVSRVADQWQVKTGGNVFQSDNFILFSYRLAQLSLSPATSKNHSALQPCTRGQIVGRLPSEGDTALLPSHINGAQRCLYWFNIHRTLSAMLPTDDNLSSQARLSEPMSVNWVPAPVTDGGMVWKRLEEGGHDNGNVLQTATMSLHQFPEGFDQNCLKHRRRQEHWDWSHWGTLRMKSLRNTENEVTEGHWEWSH